MAENIELIPEMKKWPKEQRRERTIELLKKFSWILRNICIVSQRAFRRRTTTYRDFTRHCTEPEVILMDEPFSALDPISRHHLQRLVKELHQELASTIVL